jgi:Xaa-Pro aminopeptidase
VNRITVLRQKIKEEKIDAFLIKEPQNIAYLSHCQIEGKILLSSRDKFFITTSLFAEEAKSRLNGWQIVIQKDSLEKSISEIFKRLRGKRVGFEASHFSFAEYEKLRKIKEVEWVPFSGLIENQRAIKDGGELTCIEKALEVTRAAFAYLENELETGVTEKDLSRKAIYFLRENADEEAFPPIVLFGKRTSLPHGKPSQKKLEKGELVLLDLGARVGGYCSDLTRTIFLAGIKEKWRQIHHLIVKAQKEVIKTLKPGISCSDIDRMIREKIEGAGYGKSCSDIDRMIREKIEGAGYGKNFIHGSGHGVGLAVHELPSITSKSKDILKAGMVFTLEPGIYLEGEGGVRVEEMIVVSEEGGRVLNG